MKFIRIEINHKGLFHEGDKIYRRLLKHDDTSWDAEEINNILCKLEYNLPYPNVDNKKVLFAYKENTFYEIENEIENLKEILEWYDYQLEIINIQPVKIIYEDDYQIGFI